MMQIKKNFILAGMVAVLSMSADGADGVLHIADFSVFGKLTRPGVDFPHERHYSRGTGCLDCHHRYDGGVNVLTEEELLPGTSSVSCASCHKESRDLERSYHRLCIGCHNGMKKRGTVYGPVMCGQCHAEKRN